jgi:subtilase family serine protease
LAPLRTGTNFLNAFLLALFAVLCAAPVQGAGRQALHRHFSGAVAALKPSGRLAATNHLRLAIALPWRNSAALSDLLRQLYDPASANYHHYLTPAQFTERFGPTEADYQTVISFAKTNGLKVTGTHPNRLLVDVDGTVADIESVFQVTMRTCQHPTEARLFFAPDGDPTLDLAVPVLSVNGFSDYAKPRTHLTAVPPRHRNAGRASIGSAPGGAYMGNDFRAAYLPGTSLTGAGQIVGLLELYGYSASDIANYESTNGLPNVPLTNVQVVGSPIIDAGAVEPSADIEMAIAMAPGLSGVMVYSGENTNAEVIDDILNCMATDNLAQQMSSSYDYDYYGADPVADQIFQEMAAQGQSFFDASSDYGGWDPEMSYPFNTPYITQVGGTTLTTSGPGGAWVAESVWNEGNGFASGGGICPSYPIPIWQSNVNMTLNQGSTTMRNSPDVAMVADNVYIAYNNGAWGSFAGTSLSAPLWAGLTALVNQQAAASGLPPVGFMNPILYAIGQGTNYGSCFHDITTGNSGTGHPGTVFFACQGYDLCTGWGTPAGPSLITNLLAASIRLPPTLSALHFSTNQGAFTLAVSNTDWSCYTLQTCTNLASPNWTDCTNFYGNGSALQLTLPVMANPEQFYRVRLP